MAEGHEFVVLLELGEDQGVVGACCDVDNQVLFEAQLRNFDVLGEIFAVWADFGKTGALTVDVVAAYEEETVFGEEKEVAGATGDLVDTGLAEAGGKTLLVQIWRGNAVTEDDVRGFLLFLIDVFTR